MATSKNQMEWDESRGGSRTPLNLISFPGGGDFVKATSDAIHWGWRDAGGHDPTRCLIPGVLVERLFRYAPVPEPTVLKTDRFLTKSLNVDTYLAEALDLLLDEGLLHDKDENGNLVLHKFKTYAELTERADTIVLGLQDTDVLAVTADSLEWLEDCQGNQGDQEIEWFHFITWEDVTKIEQDLNVYIDLSLMVGPRSTEAIRIETGSTFNNMIGGGNGGQLIAAIKAHFYPGGMAPQSHVFLAGRIVAFIVESRWPPPWGMDFQNLQDYAYDLPNRARWKVATRQEWASMIQTKLANGLNKSCPTLATLFEDIMDDSARLVREVQNIGDLMLANDAPPKLPFWKITEVEDTLRKDFGDLIESETEQGATLTQILAKIHDRAKALDHKGPREGVAGPLGDEGRGPKPGQLARALSEKSFTKLEATYTLALEDRATTVMEKLLLIGACLAADTVLTKAVLFHAKGMRMAVYIGNTTSDFLSLLSGERHLMDYYIGQTLAYDFDMGEVPSDLRTFMWSHKETRHLLDFEWHLLDPLNETVLKLRGELVGTRASRSTTPRASTTTATCSTTSLTSTLSSSPALASQRRYRWIKA
jgi:hypothetical protein